MNLKKLEEVLAYGTKPMDGRAFKDAFVLRAMMAATMLSGSRIPTEEYGLIVQKVDALLEELMK